MIFAAVFCLGGLLFSGFAVGIALIVLANGRVNFWRLGWVVFAVGLAVSAFARAAKELTGGEAVPSEEPGGGGESEAVGKDSPDVVWGPPPLVPEKYAESIVREIAEKHGAKGILRAIGNIRQDRLANAAKRFAREMGDNETPLAFLDSSFLQNGKAGLLLTNRGLYSSLLSEPVYLSDIEEVRYETPGLGDMLWLYTPFGKLYMLLHGMRHLQNRLLVNGEVVYSTGNPLRSGFWIELLMALAAATRQGPSAPSHRMRTSDTPKEICLEITLCRGIEQTVEVRQHRNASWEQIALSIRDLDQDVRPSVRLWRGEPAQGRALDILGGNGKYVLREPGDGWIFYDPNQEGEEVEVCVSGQGHRCPAFYVCFDLQKVFEIVRGFIDMGAFE